MEAGDTDDNVYSEDSSYWSPWRTADVLEEKLRKLARDDEEYEYLEITIQVIQVLREWGRQYAGGEALKSFLRKTPSLLHETEESIVALHYLRHWWKKQTSEGSQENASFVAVDVCCGKGYFSMFLRFLVKLCWNKEDEGTSRPKLDRIILFDKATESDINWNHILVVNNEDVGSENGLPYLELLPGTNIHDYDFLIQKLSSYNKPLAMTGIHLCKMLSPAFISLVNGLGGLDHQCPYICMAPCCLPRGVTKGTRKICTITVNQYETVQERVDRKAYKALRQQPRQCRSCGSSDHLARNCDQTPSNEDRVCVLINENPPCWTCGKIGHFSIDCPTPNARKPSTTPPMLHVDASHVAQSSSPFETYCQLLASVLPTTSAVVHDAGLTNNYTGDQGKKKREQQTHWNASRKSLFIVATNSR